MYSIYLSNKDNAASERSTNELPYTFDPTLNDFSNYELNGSSETLKGTSYDRYYEGWVLNIDNGDITGGGYSDVDTTAYFELSNDTSFFCVISDRNGMSTTDYGNANLCFYQSWDLSNFYYLNYQAPIRTIVSDDKIIFVFYNKNSSTGSNHHIVCRFCVPRGIASQPLKYDIYKGVGDAPKAQWFTGCRDNGQGGTFGYCRIEAQVPTDGGNYTLAFKSYRSLKNYLYYWHIDEQGNKTRIQDTPVTITDNPANLTLPSGCNYIVCIMEDTATWNRAISAGEVDDIRIWRTNDIEFDIPVTVSDLAPITVRTNNLFDYETMAVSVENYYLNEDGSTSQSNNWNVSDYVPCDGTEFTVCNVSGGYSAICLYDDNKQYITGKKYNLDGKPQTAVTITSQTTAKYIRFSYYKNTSNVNAYVNLKYVQLVEGSPTLIPFEPYGYKTEMPETATTINHIITLTYPLAEGDKLSYIQQKRINADGKEEAVTIPQITPFTGQNTISSTSEVSPSITNDISTGFAYELTQIYNDKLILPENILISPTLEVESGMAGSFEGTMSTSNAGYHKCELLKTELIVKKFGNEVWRGRILNTSTDFYGQMKIEAEGELSYLNDTMQPQVEYKNSTLYSVLKSVINIHNEKVRNDAEPFDKTFKLGHVTFPTEITEPGESKWRCTEYDTTLNNIKKLIKKFKAYILVRIEIENGVRVRYIDITRDFVQSSTQTIQFGENLLDYTKSFKMENLCTVALPIGAKITDNDTGDDMYVYDKYPNPATTEHEDIQIGPGYYIDSNGNFVGNTTGSWAGVAYFNEYGLHTGDSVFYSGAGYGSGALYGQFTEDGTLIAGTLVMPSSGPGTTIESKKKITIAAGAHSIRVSTWNGQGGSPLKLQAQKKTSEKLDEYFTVEGATPVDDDTKHVKHDAGSKYVVNKSLYAAYGWHEKKLQYSDLTKADDLLNMAIDYLTKTQFTEMTLELTALDLRILDVSYGDIWINMNVNVRSAPHGLTDPAFKLPCTKLKIDFSNPDNSQYTLGYATDNQISDTNNLTDSKISDLLSETPQVSSIIDAASKNAGSILNTFGDKGYVIFDRDPNDPNHIQQIMIAEKPTEEASNNRWVWNYGGFGHQKKVSGVWQNPITAITMDGQILGQFIAAHSIYGDCIAGRTLSLGHVNVSEEGEPAVYKDGDMEVISANDNKIFSVTAAYGITCDADVSSGPKAWIRIKNGQLYGGINGDSANQEQQAEPGEYCHGIINMRSVWGTTPGSNPLRGIALQADCIAFRSDKIAVHDLSEHEANYKFGVDATYTIDGKEYEFRHGILVEVRTVQQNEE